MKRKYKILTAIATPLVALTIIACGGGATDVASVNDDSIAESPLNTTDESNTENNENPSGVVKLGDSVTFKDGSKLTVTSGKFQRDEYAAGGEGSKHFVKFTVKFTNKTDQIYDPSMTSGSVSSGGEEGESVYQDDFSTPSNKVLPGKSVTWKMGYGVKDKNDLQFELRMGFLDYDTVIFTN